MIPTKTVLNRIVLRAPIKYIIAIGISNNALETFSATIIPAHNRVNKLWKKSYSLFNIIYKISNMNGIAIKSI